MAFSSTYCKDRTVLECSNRPRNVHDVKYGSRTDLSIGAASPYKQLPRSCVHANMSLYNAEIDATICALNQEAYQSTQMTSGSHN